jgi:hypothetical protein
MSEIGTPVKTFVNLTGGLIVTPFAFLPLGMFFLLSGSPLGGAWKVFVGFCGVLLNV